MKAFLLEDDLDLLDHYKKILILNEMEVSAASSERETYELLQTQKYDLYVLDLQIGNNVDFGFEICQKIREFDELAPVIFLTSHTNETDIVSGFRLARIIHQALHSCRAVET